MSTLTDKPSIEPEAGRFLRNEELVGLNRCKRCNLSYLPGKSTSALRLTYCSFFCELGDLGFSISGLEHMERVKTPPIEVQVEVPPAGLAELPEPVAVE